MKLESTQEECDYAHIILSQEQQFNLRKSRKQSFVGEECTVRWEILNFRKYLWVEEFNVIYNCIGLQKFFESESNVHHLVHRLQSKLLKYSFVIWHHLEKRVWDCYMLF